MNIPSHRQVMCFLEVCRDFHFTNAAKRLGIPQPPLSRHIKELEKLIGGSLFDRKGRTVSLTPSGEVFLKEVYQVPATLSRAVDGARRALVGETKVLRIGFVGAILGDDLLDVFEKFREQYPKTQLALIDLSPSELIRQVESGELDAALLGVRPKRLPGQLNLKTVRKERLLACFSRSHRLASRKRIKLPELEGESLVVLSSEVAPSYREFVDTLFLKQGVRLGTVAETNAAQAMLSMVVAGCGLALLPESVTSRAGDRIVAIPLAEPVVKLEQVILFSENPSDSLKAFVKIVTAAK